jgi:hypothetical protein
VALVLMPQPRMTANRGAALARGGTSESRGQRPMALGGNAGAAGERGSPPG